MREERHPEPLLDHLLRGVDVVQLHDAGRRHSSGPEERAGELVIARCTVEEDDLLVRDLLEPDATGTGEGMGGIGDEDQPVLIERDADDVAVMERPHQTDIHLLAQDELEDLLRMPGSNAHRYARVRLRKPLEQTGKDVRAQGRSRSDGEVPGAAPLQGIYLHATVAESVERSDRVGEKRLACICQLHAAGRANEEACTEIALESLEAGGQRRLRHEKSLCSSTHALPAGHLDEGGDLGQEHI